MKILGRDDEPLWLVAPFMVVMYAPKVMYWIVFAAMGWPLFKDASAVVGFDLRQMLRLKYLISHK